MVVPIIPRVGLVLITVKMARSTLPVRPEAMIHRRTTGVEMVQANQAYSAICSIL